MNINRHICNLLHDQDFVLVPGLGCFFADYEPARRIEGTHIIRPPKKVIHFNPDIKEGRENLSGYIAYTEEIHPFTADAVIKLYIRQVYKALSEEGRYIIDGVGMLMRDAEGHFDFEPMRSSGEQEAVLMPEIYAEQIPRGEEDWRQLERSPVLYLDDDVVASRGFNWAIALAPVLVLVLVLSFIMYQRPDSVQVAGFDYFSKNKYENIVVEPEPVIHARPAYPTAKIHESSDDIGAGVASSYFYELHIDSSRAIVGEDTLKEYVVVGSYPLSAGYYLRYAAVADSLMANGMAEELTHTMDQVAILPINYSFWVVAGPYTTLHETSERYTAFTNMTSGRPALIHYTLP